MRLHLTLIFTTMILQASFARYRRPRPNMMALQNLLSPNAERPLKIPQRSRCNTCNLPVQFSPPILPLPEPPCNALPPINQPLPCAPLPQMPNAMPVQLPSPEIQLLNPAIQLPNPMQIQQPNPTQILQNPMPLQLANPAPIQLPNPTPLQLQYQVPCPTQYPPNPAPCQLPNPAHFQIPNPAQIQQPSPAQFQLPNLTPMLPVAKLPEIIMEKPLPQVPCACQREILYPSPEITTNLFSSPPITSIADLIPLTPNEEMYGCPIPSPASLFNPMIPVASPVSAWTQDNLPEAVIGARSQYLRKIPIPPPTL